MPHADGSNDWSRRRHGRESPEFARVLNLSDALFAIAMTLLVLTLDPTTVSLDQVGGVLRDQPGELIAFAISFAVVSNFWWIHHRFFAALGIIKPGLILTLLAFGVSFFVPVAGLLLLLLTWPAEALVAHWAPTGYRTWLSLGPPAGDAEAGRCRLIRGFWWRAGLRGRRSRKPAGFRGGADWGLPCSRTPQRLAG